MKDNTNKKITDYIKELKPIIKKHGLENDDGCKDAIELVKKNDPRGYHALVLYLNDSVGLSTSEKKTIFATTKKAVENGLENAWFCYGSLLLLGIGVQQDVKVGVSFIEQAFLKVFSKAFIRYPLGSEKADALYCLFISIHMNFGPLSNATSLDEIKDILHEISTCYNTVSSAS